MLERLLQESLQYGVRLDEDRVAAFGRYLALLQEWNERANLVSDASEDVVVGRHFLESIALGAALREREIVRPGVRVLDVGAGAGFPGVVLKIVWPDIELTLLEATAKKTAFLSELIEALPLDNTRVLSGRAEELAHDPELREKFDLVLARAVAPLPALAELTLPFARVGGRVVTPKGSRAQQELADASRALEVLGGKAFSMPFYVPGPPQTIVALVKQRPTPQAYPRRPGTPVKSPL